MFDTLRLVLHYTYFTSYITLHEFYFKKQDSIHKYILLKIIKETHIRNVIADLPYMLHFMHAACHVADCLSYIKKVKVVFI